MTAKGAETETVPLAWFSRIIGKSQDTVRQQLADLGFTYSGGRGKHAGIPLPLAFQVAHGVEEETELSPADRKNIAQAEKAEAETAIMRREWRPLEEMQSYCSELGAFISRIVKQSHLKEAEKRRIFERLENGAAKFQD